MAFKKHRHRIDIDAEDLIYHIKVTYFHYFLLLLKIFPPTPFIPLSQPPLGEKERGGAYYFWCRSHHCLCQLSQVLVSAAFNSLPAIADFCPLPITFAISLYPDQDRQHFGPDLNSNHLTLMVFLK